MSSLGPSISFLGLISRLEAMDSQRFDISQKKRTISPPPVVVKNDAIPSAREGGLEEMDNQRFDASLREGAASPTPVAVKVDAIPGAREGGYMEPFDAQRFDISKKERTSSPGADPADNVGGAERSRKFVELWKVLDPRGKRGFPSDKEVCADQDDTPSETLSGSSSIVTPGDFSDVVEQTTPTTSDSGHIPAKDDVDSESVVQDLPPSYMTISDDHTEVRITDHILRFGGTTQTIMRPISPFGSRVSLPGTSKKVTFSRPNSPIPTLSSLNCFSSDSFEGEVEQLCEARAKRMAGEDEIKVFVREEINLTREARFKAPLQEFTLNERPVVQC